MWLRRIVFVDVICLRRWGLICFKSATEIFLNSVNVNHVLARSKSRQESFYFPWWTDVNLESEDPRSLTNASQEKGSSQSSNVGRSCNGGSGTSIRSREFAVSSFFGGYHDDEGDKQRRLGVSGITSPWLSEKESSEEALTWKTHFSSGLLIESSTGIQKGFHWNAPPVMGQWAPKNMQMAKRKRRWCTIITQRNCLEEDRRIVIHTGGRSSMHQDVTHFERSQAYTE